MAKQRIAIIGASEFQNPLILAAKERGIETHVFAWQTNDIGETTADYFYPISITDIEAITTECRNLNIDGVATIGSDLANITVANVASNLGLTANTIECVQASTNKSIMRQKFLDHGDPSPKFQEVSSYEDLRHIDVPYPLIVKPIDRSGSRGITKLDNSCGLKDALDAALEESFNKKALVEEFVEGTEYSVEYLSWKGDHQFLAITEKFTSGVPHFIECGHLEPARISPSQETEIRKIVEHALGSLGVENGASHSEIKIDDSGNIKIIEIGSRMGGDCIGSHLVQLSTGFGYLDAVIDVALGIEPSNMLYSHSRAAGVRFVFTQEDIDVLKSIESDPEVHLSLVTPISDLEKKITDSGSRHGFFVFSGNDMRAIEKYLPCR